jgi:hypothetical protein
MNCSRAQELFSEYREESLDAGTREDLRDHLAGCPDCRELMGALREVMEALGRVPELEPPLDLARKAAEAAVAQEASDPAPIRWPKSQGLPAWIRSVAAALAIASTGTFFLLEREGHTLFRTSSRFVTRAVNMGVHAVERKDRLVEDVRDLPALVSSVVTGRVERVGGRVEDYRRLLEKRRQGDVEKKQGGLGSAGAQVAEHFRTLTSGTS